MVQTCFSYNIDDNKDFSEKKLHVFISWDDKVYPCCMTGSQAIHNDERASLKDKNLKKVLDNGVLDELYWRNLACGTPKAICKDLCEER